MQAYGARNAKGEPLQTNTVMYGASLTKTVMDLVTAACQLKAFHDGPSSGVVGRRRPFLAKRLHQRAAAGSKRIRSRVRVACAKRSSASVEGRTFPPSMRAM